jgi:acyl carrier protein
LNKDLQKATLPTATSVEQWLVANIARLAEISPARIDVDRPFSEFGLESVQLFELSGDLEEFLGRSLPETVVWDYPTIRTLAHYLASGESLSPGLTA